MIKSLKIKIITLAMLLTSVASFANDTTKSAAKLDPYQFEIYGFVRNDFSFDSRKTLAAVGELFNFIPMDHQLNAIGEDLNNIPSSRFLAIVSRFGFNFKSPSFNGMHITAKIETDFCGAGANYNMFRIRHAYVGLNWKHHQIIAGQAWHPMTSELIPSIVSINTGAPFNAFSRTPQLRYNAIIGPVTLSAAAIYQFQYTSPGPEGSSTKYQVFGGMPEFYI